MFLDFFNDLDAVSFSYDGAITCQGETHEKYSRSSVFAYKLNLQQIQYLVHFAKKSQLQAPMQSVRVFKGMFPFPSCELTHNEYNIL